MSERWKQTTTFEPFNDEDLINKAYQDTKLSKIQGQIKFVENNYNEFELHYNKYSVEEVLFQGAVKTTIQIPFDKEFLDNYDNADDVLKDFLFNERFRADLEEVNDVIQWFCSWI